jgi:hypothetical protein
MIPFALIPLRDWLWAAVVAALLAGGALFVHHERDIGAARVEAVRQTEHAAAAAVAASAVASAAAESQRREARIQEVVHATQQAASQVAADASSAARERDALRRERDALLLQLRAAIASSRGSVPSHPAFAAGGEDQPGGDPIGVLADVLDRADQRAGVLAEIADRRRITAEACERSSDALNPDRR